MKYPRELEDKVKEIEAIIEKWPAEKLSQRVNVIEVSEI